MGLADAPMDKDPDHENDLQPADTRGHDTIISYLLKHYVKSTDDDHFQRLLEDFAPRLLKQYERQQAAALRNSTPSSAGPIKNEDTPLSSGPAILPLGKADTSSRVPTVLNTSTLEAAPTHDKPNHPHHQQNSCMYNSDFQPWNRSIGVSLSRTRLTP